MTHGSRELDVDAEKLLAMGADPGPELEDFTDEPRGCPTPDACCAIVEIELLRNALEQIQNWHPIADLPPQQYAIVGRWGGGVQPPYWHELRAKWFEFQGKREWTYVEKNRPSPFYDDDGNYAEPTHFYSIPEPPPHP